MTPSTTPTRPQRPARRPGRAAALPPDERRAAIVEAVIPLLVQHGANVTTRQIAMAAGVAEGTIFRVFPDKPALMLAAAHATMDPASGRAELEKIDHDLDLHDTIRAVAEHLLERMEKVMAVMIAVRGTDRSQHEPGSRGEGPPKFIVEANQALLDALTKVFARHREELRVEPARVALMVRSLVFGSRHPGMQPKNKLTAEEIATVLVSGVSSQDVSNKTQKMTPKKGER